MLREEVLISWGSCKDKMRKTIKSAPEILNLEKQIATKNRELETKEQRIKELRDKLSNHQPVLGAKNPVDIQNLEEELHSFELQKHTIKDELSSLREKLGSFYPFSLYRKELEGEIQQLKVQNAKLHYLFSLETSLKNRQLENQQYENRLRLEEEKRNALGKKLEWIKGLVADNKIERLKTLYKRGDI